MNNTDYRFFIHESIKITLFCLLVTGIFKLLGASNDSLLIILNMAVMSAAATFSPDKKSIGRHKLRQ